MVPLDMIGIDPSENLRLNKIRAGTWRGRPYSILKGKAHREFGQRLSTGFVQLRGQCVAARIHYALPDALTSTAMILRAENFPP